MGILKTGKECIIIQGKDFGKKIKIERVQGNKVYYKKDNKEKALGILHVFPLN
jgi:hypothetical protein